MSSRIAKQWDNISRFSGKAQDLLDKGFATKSAQKQANGYLNNAFSSAREIVREQVCRTYGPGPDHTDEQWQAYVDKLDEYDLPHDLHQLRERHIDKASEIDATVAAWFRVLANTRTLVKDEPVEPPKPKVKSEYEVKAEKSIKAEMERLKTSYLRAIELGHIFNGIPVSASSHWVINQYGTEFVRTFYYLEGKLTRLNLIIAAAEQVAREKRGQ